MTSISSCNCPVRNAARNRSTTACCSDRLTCTRGRRAATCSRARRAICRTAAADFPIGLGDLAVRHVEDLAEHEHRPLRRPERFQHGQHRDRDALRELDVLGDVGAGQQRFRQPLADVFLAAARQRSQAVERLPRDDPDEVRPRVAHLRLVDVGPPQPGLLQHVLRVGRRPEHLVGDREQQAAMGDERVLGHAVDATPESQGARPAESRRRRRSPATRSRAPCCSWSTGWQRRCTR